MPEIFTHRCPNIAPRIWVDSKIRFSPYFFFSCIRHLLPSAHADDAGGLERWDRKNLDPKMAGKREAGPLQADRYKWSDMEPPKKNDPNQWANNALVVINGVITSINGPINGHKPCKWSYHPTSYGMRGRTCCFNGSFFGLFLFIALKMGCKASMGCYRCFA